MVLMELIEDKDRDEDPVLKEVAEEESRDDFLTEDEQMKPWEEEDKVLADVLDEEGPEEVVLEPVAMKEVPTLRSPQSARSTH